MSASEIATNETLVSTDDTDLTKLSAEELLAVVAELRQENKTLLKAKNKVGLTFKRIPEDGNDSITRLEDNQFPFLTKIDSLSVTKDESTDGNIALIEGENLAVLAALQMTHKEKVDVIYIDPPYNTGNDDFIYEDKRIYVSDASDLENLEKTLDGKVRTVGKDDPFRHSKWLSFMERRLFLAKELLSDTGVIFISLDDNEIFNLKLLMDSIFGSENFLANMIWKSKSGGANDSSGIATDHEYVMCYSKSSSTQIFNDNLLIATTQYNQEDEKGKFSLERLDKQSLGYLESLDFPIYDREGKEYLPKQPAENVKQARWRWSKSTVEERYHELVFKNGSVYTKNYVKTEGHKPRSLMIEERFGRSRTGSTDLKPILGGFSYPKPIKLIKHLLSISAKPDAIILDFFAGSGTTGHAIAELNKEDGGNRSAILVTNNEGGIARNITRERIARVLTGENWADGKEHESLPGNLAFYTLGFKTLSSNPLTTAQMMENKFDGLLSLENNVLNVVENNSDEDYAIYRNSGKVIFVWKDLFSLYDGECEELLESLKSTMDANEFIAYVPSDSKDPGIASDGWKVIAFPHDYIERYEAMIATMRRNQTLPNSK